MNKPSTGDILVWSITTSAMWIVGGMVTAVVLYYNENRIPTMAPTPEHMSTLLKLLIAWGIFGFIIGLVGVFHFVNMADVMGPVHAYSIHLIHMSVGAIIVGGLLGAILYPLLMPPPGAILRSISWRIPVCAVAALFAENIALRIIPKIPKLFE